MESKKQSSWIWFLTEDGTTKQGSQTWNNFKGWNKMEWSLMGEGQSRILHYIDRGKMNDYYQEAIKDSLACNQYERIRKHEIKSYTVYSNPEENTYNDNE